MKRGAVLLSVLCLLSLSSNLCAKEQEDVQEVVIVVGAGGSPEYEQQFAAWANDWQKAATEAGANVTCIGGDAVVSRDQEASRSDSELLESAIQRLANEPANVKADWIVLIGHGTSQGDDAKFNLRGPDVAAKQLATWLKPRQSPLVIVNAASASGPFVNALSAPGRVIVTATKSGSEVNFARFGSFLPKALSDPKSDLDHDEQVSLLEAVINAASDTTAFYAAEGRIQTEHAILDDNADQAGTPVELLQSVLRGEPVAVKKDARSGTTPEASTAVADGDIASQTALVPGANQLVLTDAEASERDRLEQELKALRRRRAELEEQDYLDQLGEKLLVLAHIYQVAENRAKSVPSSP